MADGTEDGELVGAHAAVFLTAPDSMRQVTTTLNKAYFTFLDKVFPLTAEVVLRGEVRLPRLRVAEVHGVVVTIGVLVAQAAEGVAELMYDNRFVLWAVSRGKVIGVVNTATAVGRGIR